jgi:hypothetical protein
MKVKIFYAHDNHKNLEKEMNEWFEQNPNIKVIMMRSTQSGRLDCHYSVIVQYT